LFDALKTVHTTPIGAYAAVTDPIVAGAKAFYEKFGFRPLNDNHAPDKLPLALSAYEGRCGASPQEECRLDQQVIFIKSDGVANACNSKSGAGSGWDRAGSWTRSGGDGEGDADRIVSLVLFGPEFPGSVACAVLT
jgi:hypothetical protein